MDPVPNIQEEFLLKPGSTKISQRWWKWFDASWRIFNASVIAQAANKFFAGPTSGVSAIPSFRSIVTADLPLTLVGPQTANQVYAGPTSGAAAAPAFRAIVVADLPAAVAGTQTANFIYAGPTTGVAAAPAFRAMVAADGPPAAFSGSIATAKLTVGGVNGSMTFVNGILTAQTPAT